MGRCTTNATALNLIGLQPEHTLDRDALLDEISRNASVLVKVRTVAMSLVPLLIGPRHCDLDGEQTGRGGNACTRQGEPWRDQREDVRFFGCNAPGLPLSARPDVLTFETEPLDEDVAVVGPIEIELWVSTDAPDTDFTAKLIDVYPSSKDFPTGFAMLLSDSIFRCRYRKSWEQPEPITPGEVFRITIEPFATANLFKAGHRIRLDISSSNFPKFDVNPNTGGPEGMGRTFNIARNGVHMSVNRPSNMILQLAPPSSLLGL